MAFHAGKRTSKVIKIFYNSFSLPMTSPRSSQAHGYLIQNSASRGRFCTRSLQIGTQKANGGIAFEAKKHSQSFDQHKSNESASASTPGDKHPPDKHTEWRIPRKIKIHLQLITMSCIASNIDNVKKGILVLFTIEVTVCLLWDFPGVLSRMGIKTRFQKACEAAKEAGLTLREAKRFCRDKAFKSENTALFLLFFPLACTVALNILALLVIWRGIDMSDVSLIISNETKSNPSKVIWFAWAILPRIFSLFEVSQLFLEGCDKHVENYWKKNEIQNKVDPASLSKRLCTAKSLFSVSLKSSRSEDRTKSNGAKWKKRTTGEKWIVLLMPGIVLALLFFSFPSSELQPVTMSFRKLVLKFIFAATSSSIPAFEYTLSTYKGINLHDMWTKMLEFPPFFTFYYKMQSRYSMNTLVNKLSQSVKNNVKYVWEMAATPLWRISTKLRKQNLVLQFCVTMSLQRFFKTPLSK